MDDTQNYTIGGYANYWHTPIINKKMSNDGMRRVKLNSLLSREERLEVVSVTIRISSRIAGAALSIGTWRCLPGSPAPRCRPSWRLYWTITWICHHSRFYFIGFLQILHKDSVKLDIVEGYSWSAPIESGTRLLTRPIVSHSAVRLVIASTVPVVPSSATKTPNGLGPTCVPCLHEHTFIWASPTATQRHSHGLSSSVVWAV